jgi:hypothetical protein
VQPNRQILGGRLSATLRYVPDHPTRISIRAAHLTTDQQRRIRDAILAIRDELGDAQVDAEVNAATVRHVDWPDPELAVDAAVSAVNETAGIDSEIPIPAIVSRQALDART